VATDWYFSAPNGLTSKNYCRCPGELLQRKQTERVPHDDRHARTGVSMQQSSTKRQKGYEGQVCLGLAPSCREPQEVHDKPFVTVGIDNRFCSKKNEAQLEWAPQERLSI